MFPPQVKIAKQFRGNEWHWILLILDNHEKLNQGIKLLLECRTPIKLSEIVVIQKILGQARIIYLSKIKMS